MTTQRLRKKNLARLLRIGGVLMKSYLLPRACHFLWAEEFNPNAIARQG